MDVRQLECFVEIVRCRNFTSAAKKLFISQPMLTRVVKTLEQELGVSLIERTSKSFRLTDAGEALYEQAQRVLTHFNDIYQNIDDVKSARYGNVKLSCPGVLLDMYFAPLLTEFQKKYPGIDISIIENGSKVVIGDVLSGKADLGLVMLPIEDFSQFDTTVVLRDKVELMVNKQHRLAKMTQISVEELRTERIVTFGETSTLHDQFIQLCSQYGFSPHISYKSLLPHFTAELLTLSSCVAVLPGPVAHRYLTPALKTVSMEQMLPWEIAVISRKNHYQSHAAGKLKAFICDYFAMPKETR
ncbi:MAG: LysR family transcriptional regulator [Roseburia sp.]|nr:LysR family transcriptional regulator [Roseburia sp.]